MTPQLWTRNLEWLEWRQMHPDLDDREAEYLYQVEQKMFQNYQDEIRNQMMNRQTRLVGDLMNLSADISTVLTEGGVKTQPRRYVLMQGTYPGPFIGIAVGRDYGNTAFNILIGDEFVFDFIGNENFENAKGTYRAIRETPINGTTATTSFDVFLVAQIIYAGFALGGDGPEYIKISDSTTINSNVDF